MDKLRCLAIDDEYLALKILSDYVDRIPFLEMVATSKSAMSAFEILESEKIDLLLLDIQMPEISGLDFLSTLKNPPLVILTTAYQEYALQGYDYEVVDYLLKPIRFERFLRAINKAKEHIILKKGPLLNTKMETNIVQNLPKDHCFLKSGYKSEKVFYRDFIYVEGQKEYITIHTTNKKYTLLKSMVSMLDELEPEKFIRIHKSYIVASDKVSAYFGTTIELGDVKLPVGRSYKEAVYKRFKS